MWRMIFSGWLAPLLCLHIPCVGPPFFTWGMLPDRLLVLLALLLLCSIVYCQLKSIRNRPVMGSWPSQLDQGYSEWSHTVSWMTAVTRETLHVCKHGWHSVPLPQCCPSLPCLISFDVLIKIFDVVIFWLPQLLSWHLWGNTVQTGLNLLVLSQWFI